MPYSLLARFYDLENADFIEDLDFWVGLAKDSGGPVLELGCGSGRVTQQIARAGINIIGLDNSEEMLALAHAKLSRNPKVASLVKLIKGDMTAFEIPNPDVADEVSSISNLRSAIFNLVLVPFNTFMHLGTAADQLALLQCARKHLKPGGQLVLDLTNPAPAYADPPAETLTLERTFRDEANNLTIEQFSTVRLDRVAQLAQIVYHYDLIAADGAVKRTLVPIVLRYTFPAEMALLLAQTGFKMAHLYGDYAENPLADDSDRMIVIAEAQ